MGTEKYRRDDSMAQETNQDLLSDDHVDHVISSAHYCRVVIMPSRRKGLTSELISHCEFVCTHRRLSYWVQFRRERSVKCIPTVTSVIPRPQRQNRFDFEDDLISSVRRAFIHHTNSKDARRKRKSILCNINNMQPYAAAAAAAIAYIDAYIKPCCVVHSQLFFCFILWEKKKKADCFVVVSVLPRTIRRTARQEPQGVLVHCISASDCFLISCAKAAPVLHCSQSIV